MTLISVSNITINKIQSVQVRDKMTPVMDRYNKDHNANHNIPDIRNLKEIQCHLYKLIIE